MKNIFYIKMLLLFAAFLVPLPGALAQEKKDGKVILKVEKDGKTVVDTVFDLKEGQDPEELTEAISRVVGEDVMIFSGGKGEQNVFVMSKHDGSFDWQMEHIEGDSALKKCIEKEVILKK
jgi:hypothetical protein